MMLRTESTWLQTETVPDKAKAAVSPEIQMTQTGKKPRFLVVHFSDEPHVVPLMPPQNSNAVGGGAFTCPSA